MELGNVFEINNEWIRTKESRDIFSAFLQRNDDHTRIYDTLMFSNLFQFIYAGQCLNVSLYLQRFDNVSFESVEYMRMTDLKKDYPNFIFSMKNVNKSDLLAEVARLLEKKWEAIEDHGYIDITIPFERLICLWAQNRGHIRYKYGETDRYTFVGVRYTSAV